MLFAADHLAKTLLNRCHLSFVHDGLCCLKLRSSVREALSDGLTALSESLTKYDHLVMPLSYAA